MAVEYHLLTWAGKGVTVTFTDAGDVVNLTAHGARNGQAFRFIGTGTPPTDISKDTKYYLRGGADANKFLVYPTQSDAIAGTNQITFTGTGSGAVQVVGEYWYSLPATDPGGGGNYRARYGEDGSERVFASYNAFASYINTIKTPDLLAVLEIHGTWTDSSTYTTSTATLGVYSLEVTTMINGVRGPGYHNGIPGGGYKRVVNANNAAIPTNSRDIVDGIECENLSSGTAASGVTLSVGQVLRNCILKAYNGVYSSSAGYRMYNNIALRCTNAGYYLLSTSGLGALIYNNLSAKNAYGFLLGGGSTFHAAMINNVAAGNSVSNWSNKPTAGTWIGKNNAGQTGDDVWGDASVLGVTTDANTFVDYANDDFRCSGDQGAHTTSSVLVDAGDRFVVELSPYSITNSAVNLGDPRPAYKNGDSTGWDIGPFEFDWGYGLAPLQVTLTISGMAADSVLAVYKTSDGSAIISPTTIGASGTHSITYSYTGDLQIRVEVRKGTSGTKYLPYSAPGLITSSGFFLIVNQVIDGVLNG